MRGRFKCESTRSVMSRYNPSLHHKHIINPVLVLLVVSLFIGGCEQLMMRRELEEERKKVAGFDGALKEVTMRLSKTFPRFDMRFAV